MKLAIFSPGFLPVPAVKGGAVEQLITNIIDENEKYDMLDIDLYTVDDPLIRDINYKNTRLLRFTDPYKNKITYIKHIFRRIFERFFSKKFQTSVFGKKVVENYKCNYYDAVLVENNIDIFNALVPKLAKEKKFFHLHNDISDNDPAKTIYKTKYLINNSDRIFVVSNFLENKLQKLGAENVQIILNGVSKNSLTKLSVTSQELRRKLGYKTDDLIYTFVGRISSEKGIEDFIKAISDIKSNRSIKGLIVGNINTKYGKYIKQNFEVKNVQYVGYIPNDQIGSIMSISDVLVIPTKIEEAFGMVALEAMSMKLPIIASDSGELPKLLENTGAPIIKRDDKFVSKLRQSIIDLSQSGEKRKEIGEKEYQNSKKYPSTKKQYFDNFVELMKEEK